MMWILTDDPDLFKLKIEKFKDAVDRDRGEASA